MVLKVSLVLVLILTILPLGWAQETQEAQEAQEVQVTQEGQEEPALTVEEMVFCTAVEDREPVGTDTAFAATVGQVYCYTKINGAEDATTIYHVWYLNGEEKATVELAVKGDSWRTWSSKTIPDEWAGNWRVDVKSETGEVLKSKEFVVR